MLALQSNTNAAQMQANQDIHNQQPQQAPRSRKRKTPPTNPEPNPNPIHHMIATMPPGAIPQGYQYAPNDFSPAGLPPSGPQDDSQQPGQSPPPGQSGRALSSSKRAEQNRKAQRAFRERRDQSVSPLLLC